MGLTLSSLSTVLSSAMNKSEQDVRRKILGNAENQTWGWWVRSKYATSEKQSIFVSAFAIEQQQQQQQSWPDVEVRQKLFAEKLVEIFFSDYFRRWAKLDRDFETGSSFFGFDRNET